MPPTTASCITASPHQRVTALVIICLAPCHQTSQSFALPPATKPVSHLPCPLPLLTASPHHRITASPRHRITALVSHLPCLLPPSQSVIYLAPCHQASQSFALPPTTASPHHRTTASLHHQSPHHRISQSFALSPATKPVSHLPCPLPPNHSHLPCITASLHHHVTVLVICLAPCHQASQSFALPPATKPVSHLPCPLPPHHSITMSPRHHISQSFTLSPATKPVSHLPCPLPPNQSVRHHRITASPRHRITTSLH